MAKSDVEFKSYRTDLLKRVQAGNENALIELGIGITGTAKGLAPVDFGQLRNAIQWKTAKSQGGFESGYNLTGKKGKTLKEREDSRKLTESVSNDSLLVGSTVKHAIYQEFGTQNMKPQPFMRPAIEKYTKGNSAKKTIGKIINDYVTRTETKK